MPALPRVDAGRNEARSVSEGGGNGRGRMKALLRWLVLTSLIVALAVAVELGTGTAPTTSGVRRALSRHDDSFLGGRAANG